MWHPLQDDRTPDTRLDQPSGTGSRDDTLTFFRMFVRMTTDKVQWFIRSGTISHSGPKMRVTWQNHVGRRVERRVHEDCIDSRCFSESFPGQARQFRKSQMREHHLRE